MMGRETGHLHEHTVQCDRCSNRDLYKGPQGLRGSWGAEPGFGRQGSLPMASVHGKICTYGMVMEIYAGVRAHVCVHAPASTCAHTYNGGRVGVGREDVSRQRICKRESMDA